MMKLYLILAFIGAAFAAKNFDKQCAQKPDPGFCKAKLQRWYFNVASGKCERFSYSGCGGNENQYLIKERCEKTCIPKTQNTLLFGGLDDKVARKLARLQCSQPRYTGPCKAHALRFYFDSKSGTCHPFIYGGCRGNGNNFATMRDCVQKCG